MSLAEIKSDLFHKIDQLDKKDLIRFYGVLLNFINNNQVNGEWDDLTSKQKNAILEGIKQLDNGEGISHSKAISQFRSRFLNHKLTF